MIKNAKEKLDAIRQLIFKDQSPARETPAELPPAESTPKTELEQLTDALNDVQQKLDAFKNELEQGKSALNSTKQELKAQQQAFTQVLALVEEMASAPTAAPAEKRRAAFSRRTDPLERARLIAESIRKGAAN